MDDLNINKNNFLNIIINKEEENNQLINNKYNIKWLLENINEKNLNLLETKFNNLNNKNITIFDFLNIFSEVLLYENPEIIQGIFGLIDIYKIIKKSIFYDQKLKFSNITSFWIDNYFGIKENYELSLSKFPIKSYFKNNEKMIRDIDINKPKIIENSNNKIKKIVKNKIINDIQKKDNSNFKKAIYSKFLNKLFVMDTNNSEILVYNEFLKKEKIIKSKLFNCMVNFFFSEKTLRIAALYLYKNNKVTIVFWENLDNFSFHFSFDFNIKNDEEINNLYYLNCQDTWLLSDNKGNLIFWSLLKQNIIQNKKIVDKNIDKNISIINFVEIEHLKLLALSTSEKYVILLNLKNNELILSLKFPLGGVHQIMFFKTYQLLIIGSYEQSIPLFKIESVYNDLTLINKLTGHEGIITSIICLENTPMLFSADDCGIIKNWNIRNFCCLQTISIGKKIQINSLNFISNYKYLSCIGKRISFIPLENFIIDKEIVENSFYQPLFIKVDKFEKKIILVSNNDLKIINLIDGRTITIHKNLINNDGIDIITYFKKIKNTNKFILGDYNGNLKIYDNKGEFYSNLPNHNSEIIWIGYDIKNELISSLSIDGTFKMNKYYMMKENSCSTLLKNIDNINYKKGLISSVISYYFRQIIIICENCIYLFDFETCKLLFSISFKNTEIIRYELIEYIGLVIILCNDGYIYFLNYYLEKEIFLIKLAKIFNLNKKIECKNYNLWKIYYEFNIDNLEIIKKKNIKNKNKFSKLKEHSYELKFYISDSNGIMYIFELSKLFENLDLIVLKNDKKVNISRSFVYKFENLNFSSYPKNCYDKNDYSKFILKKDLLNKILIKKIRIHSKSINYFKIINLGEKLIITCSSDKFIKFTDMKGNIICSLNINYPLPNKWKIHHYLNKYIKNKRINEFNCIINNIKNDFILNKIKDQNKKYRKYENNEIETLTINKKKIILKNNFSKNKIFQMKDIYSPKDIYYKNYKEWFKNEILGPNLKHVYYMKKNKENKIKNNDYEKNIQENFEKINDKKIESKIINKSKIKIKMKKNYMNKSYLEKMNNISNLKDVYDKKQKISKFNEEEKLNIDKKSNKIIENKEDKNKNLLINNDYILKKERLKKNKKLKSHLENIFNIDSKEVNNYSKNTSKIYESNNEIIKTKLKNKFVKKKINDNYDVFKKYNDEYNNRFKNRYDLKNRRKITLANTSIVSLFIKNIDKSLKKKKFTYNSTSFSSIKKFK